MRMTLDMNEDDEDNILYELLIHTEWPLEPEILGEDAFSQGGSIFYRTLMHTPSNLLSLASNVVNSFWKRNSISPNIARILNSGSEWQLGVGAQGAVIAVLQDSSLEVRAKKDEYASVVGKNFNLYNDPFPKWRRVSWSSECSMVAVAYSNGAVEIFNTVGASLFTIYPPKFQEEKLQVDSSNALAALIFSDVRTEKIKWAAELILIDYYGNVRGYFVSPTEGYQESHSFSFNRLYPHGISAAVEIGSLVIVAGSCQYVNDPSLRNNGLGHGLSIWRMLSDFPYYKQVPTIDEEEYTPPNVSFFNHIPGFEPPSPYDSIFRLCVSPLGRQVAALHSSGSISIWDIPSLRKRKFWSLEYQPGFDSQNFDTNYVNKIANKEYAYSGLKNHLVDVRWWSEKAVILARFSGAVTVCSINSLTNLLGESPEFFEGVPQISETYDRCFLALEMERNLLKGRSKSMSILDSSLSEGDDSVLEDTDLYSETDLSVVQKTKILTQSFLFWITDAERFRPFNKRPKVIAKTCRLLCLKSTTPMELFTRKIENEEYGEALALAQRYNLDCDLVYQQQWRKSPVTVITIQDYLTKIRKRSWVLAECLSRVPNDIDAARELILYGLRGTELDTLVGVAEGTNDDEFFVSDLSLEYEEDMDLDPEEAEREAQEWAAKDMKLRRELLSKIDFENLNKEQVEVVKARQILLKYYDRLSAYEILLGGPHVAPENYDPIFYEKFRNQTEIEAAAEMARDYNCRGVEVLFTYHGEVTLSHRLPILSNFPPTMGPYNYRSLLPECDLSGEVFEWEEDSLRDPDWCEDLLCRQAVGLDPDKGLSLLYENDPQLDKFREVALSADLVSKWYQMRTREMEESSHFVDVSLDLLKLARERNCPGLEDLQNTFDVLEILVYEVGLSDLSLKKFEMLSDLEKFSLLLSTSTSETLIQNIRRWGQTFLNHCEKKESGLGRRLLREYIVSTASQDLSISLKTIQHSQKDMTDPILGSPEEILQVALDSVYACEKEAQLPRAFAILECLPVRHAKKDSNDLRHLHNLVDAMEDHLSIAELLSSHSVLVSPQYIKNISSNEIQVKLLMTRLARTTSRREAKLSVEDWNKLLSDMLEMQQKVFGVVEPQTCFEILTEALLTSGIKEYIDYAADLLETRCDGSPVRNPYLQKLPYDTSVRLIIKAATEYFNSSESYLDKEMILAKHCLQLIDSSNEEIEMELDLISSLEILLDIGINKLPLQVRLSECRLDLIVEALIKRPENYQMGNQILRLATLLRVCGDSERLRRAKVITLIAEAAFNAENYEAANSWCLQLIKEGYGEGWEICARLGKCEESRDFSLKAKFLDFALTYASYEYLEELLVARSEVELSLLYNRIRDKIDTNESMDSDDGFEDARAESEEESCDEWEDPIPDTPAPLYSSKRLLFSVTKNVLSVTAASTSSLVSSVANKRMWKNAIGWLRPLRRSLSKSSKSDIAEKRGNVDFLKQGCYAFYADVNPEAHISNLGPTYKSYAPASITSPALDVSFTLFRIALIEESLHRGNNIQTNIAVLQEVIKGVLQEDLLLGFSFLLLLNSPQDVHQIFSSLPRTDVSLQIFLYYCALQIYTFLHPWQKPGIAPVFLHSPNDVIDLVRYIVGTETLIKDENILAYMDYFRNIDRMIIDYVQVQALRKLGAGIDIERFLAEPEYKKDTVLGLAMTSESDVFDLAVSLATKYDVSLWEVYMTHVQFLFDSSDIDCSELKKKIKESEIIKHLRKQPAEFVSFMEKNILLTINGKDHEKLTLYFTLISDTSDDDTIKEISQLHINNLDQLKDAALNLDYKALLNPSSNSLEILKPVLNAQNVDILVSVAQSISQKDFILEPSMIYCAWAQKKFFDMSGKRKPKTATEWIRRFDETKDILKKLKSQDVNLLIKNFVFSEEGISLVPLEARREMIKKTAKYCKLKSEEGETDSESWEAAFSRFEKLEKHLDLLRSDIFKGLSDSSDPIIKSYSHQFMLSCGEESSLINLSRKILTDMCSLDVLRSILAVYPEDINQVPEDIFLDILKSTLSNLGNASKDDEELEENFRVFLHLLKELKNYCEEGGEMLDSDEVLDEVRSFAKNETNSLLTRVKVFSASEQFLPLTEKDINLLQSMKTGNIVTEAFSSPTKINKEKSNTRSLKPPSNIDDEGERRELLQNLIDNLDSVKKAKSIIELLKIWPKFQPQTYLSTESNPYLCVFQKLLKQPKLKNEKEVLGIILDSTKLGVKNKELHEECIQILVNSLVELSSEESLKCSLKIALLSSHHPSQQVVIEKYKILQKINENFYDEELLELILERSIVVDILSTCLYGPVVSYLSEEENAERRKSVIRDLESSNHWMEAACLTMYSSSIPRAFKTASAAVKTFKKLF